MNIPIIDLGKLYNEIKPEIDSAVSKVIADTKFILGPEVCEIEKKIAEYCRSEYAVGCASGTDAILLSLMSLGIEPGDEIITTPFTFFATAGSISRLGAIPVFVDIDPGTFNLNPELVEMKVTNRTKGILPVHLFGQMVDMDPLMDLKKRYNLFIVEDACQSIGAKYKNKIAGSVGDTGCFSFFPTKNLGGFGDGGMLVTNDSDVYEKAKSLRVHGAKDRYFHDYIGINSRLDTIQAAILLAEIKYLDKWTEKRRKNASLYNSLFRGIKNVQIPVDKKYFYHVYNQYTLRVENRPGLVKALEKEGIGYGIYYPLPLHMQNCYKGLGYRKGDFPESEKASEEVLSIPVHPFLTKDLINKIADTVRNFYGA
ncbi:MAG: DegT/DnrJ/EryC1/StrS family aminotransferase [Candidatus Aureabacteria bacterium]|nr:DegT/DnrJ/EryC1/StrS family aminotransferase [Candidatus Auribacterota bacterium]